MTKPLPAITSSAMHAALREPPKRVLFKNQPGLPDGIYTLTDVTTALSSAVPKKRQNRSARRRLR